MSCLFARLIVLAMKGYFMRATPPKSLRSLISVFDKLSLEITITYTSNIEISRFQLVTAAKKAFFILTKRRIRGFLKGYTQPVCSATETTKKNKISLVPISEL